VVVWSLKDQAAFLRFGIFFGENTKIILTKPSPKVQAIAQGRDFLDFPIYLSL